MVASGSVAASESDDSCRRSFPLVVGRWSIGNAVEVEGRAKSVPFVHRLLISVLVVVMASTWRVSGFDLVVRCFDLIGVDVVMVNCLELSDDEATDDNRFFTTAGRKS